MKKKYIGKNRADNLAWLENVWLEDGPPVCFLQGFSGVGKTDLARDFRELAEKQGKWKQAVINEVADRPTPSILESLMELSVVLSHQGLPEMEQVLFEQTRPDLAYALELALQQPVVIILDEAQRFFRPDSDTLLPAINGILSALRTRSNLPGRLLLLSDRMVEEARWSEWIPKRTLKRLEPEEAVAALEAKLEEAGVSVEIPPERMREVVRDLDFNPRAIEALVGALRYDSLDEIIESNPGLWAVRDREVSRDFLKALERDLLERTMRNLGEVFQRKLWRLAVHRRSFRREALEKLCGSKDEAGELRSVLVTRYLLNIYKGSLALNPIVREISLTHLRDAPAEFRRAHSSAADYHMRHFKSKQIVGSQSKLGESFAELRYHLVQAGREADLSVIGQRFTDHLKQELHSTSPIPDDAEELAERIGVLTALLGNGGAKGLEYHLARCLQRRDMPGDIQQAVIHAKRSLGPGAQDAWYLLASLRYQSEGADAAIADVRRGVSALKSPDSMAPLYQLGAEILARAGKTDEAVALLKDGIGVIPPDKSLFSLFNSCADLLAKADRIDEAVALLEEGIGIIPPGKNLFSLYQALSVAYCREGRVQDAIASLREGLRRIPQRFNRHRLVEGAQCLCAAINDARTLAEILSGTGADAIGPEQAVLGAVLQCQMRGDWLAAADTASAARQKYTQYCTLACFEAFSRLAAGDPDAAWLALSSSPNLHTGTGEPHGWLATFIHLRRGALPEASAALATYLGRPVDEGRELNESFLLRLWDQHDFAPDSNRLCYHYPIMPPSLTGQNHAVHRILYGDPVLPELTVTGNVGHELTPRATAAAAPDIYVSYAWGEDSSEAGRQREEIVDRLCAAVEAAGHVIGRDKDRLQGGDSIERFAHEISKAKRIVAVVSEKSLNSEFCMAHELFRAFRRCDYQRAEFQEKVIALVMDDARPLLKDHLTVVALAKVWRDRLEKLRTELESVDPTRKSADPWVFVDMMEDMCPRLPAMLDALRDVVMKRGFGEIVNDGFREVLRLLPPQTRS
ncbi:TIR domain-containing protein [bacterium]|nr:TIR domain-containing protein [bacterium]